MRRHALTPQRSRSVEIIIAHRPSYALIERVRDAATPVLLVDDGSGPDYQVFFHKTSSLPRVVLLRHAVRLGRGAALRTAMNHLLCAQPEVESVLLEGLEIPARLLPAIVRFRPILPAYRAAAMLQRFAPWLILAMLLVLVGVEIQGFRTGNLFAQAIWTPEGQQKLIQFAGLYVSAVAAVMILVPWLFTGLATGLAALITFALLPKATLAAALVLLSAGCLGSLLGGESIGLSIMLGLAVYAGAMPLVARIPIHYPLVYGIGLAIPIAIRRPRPRLPKFSDLSSWSERAAFALLVFVFLTHWFAMLKPEAGADGLAMHLAIPMNIAQHHMLTYEPSRFVWAVMPMGADLTYALAYLLGGEQAARLLNLALLAILLALLHQAIRKWVSPAIAWLLLALFAATPLVQLVTGELMAENLLAAFLLASFLAVWRRSYIIAALLAGAAISTKLGALPFVILLVLYAATTKPRKRWVPALALLIATAAPPYTIAWVKTHNPIFPFLNERFHSPLLPHVANLRDERFHEPLTWRIPYDLTFRSNAYYEGQNGSFGFQYLVLAPMALMAAALLRRRNVIGAAGIALAASAIVLRSDPNARYLYPELALLTIPFAALTGWSSEKCRPLYGGLVVFAVAATAMNIWFLPGSSYYHKDLYGPFTASEREIYLRETAPLRLVIGWFEQVHPGAPVLLTHDTSIAGLTGDVYENQWHQYNTADRIRHASDAEGVRRLLDQWRVRFLIVRRPGAGRILRPPALRELVSKCTIPEYVYSDFFIARLEDQCSTVAEPELVAATGQFDDFDPLLLYRGDWDSSGDFDGPFSHTVSYTDAPGAQVSFTFVGTELSWIFTRAANRGVGAVTIDGVPKGEIDLYSPITRWQDQANFSGLAPGKHLLVIRATGRRQGAATGAFIDVDALRVR